MTMQIPEHIQRLFPKKTVDNCKGKHIVNLPKTVRQAITKRAHVDCESWTHKNRYLRDSTHQAVPWSKESTPYLDEPMFAISQSWVQDFVFVGCPQSGKSEFGHNVVAWSTEHHAGPVLYVYPDELTSHENSTERVLPMFKDSPALRKHMTGHDDDETKTLIRLKHINIYFGWSSSVRRLANKPIMILIEDEVDKFDTSAGAKEGDPSKLAKKRTTRFGDRYKRVRISTCTTDAGPIWSAHQESRYHFLYHAKCPDCGHGQAMEFSAQDSFTYPPEYTAQEIREERAARYVCSNGDCGSKWDDFKRDLAVRAGEWICTETGESMRTVVMTRKPKMLAVRLPSWYSSFVSLSEVAGDYVEAEESGKQKLKQVFRNQHEALPYENIAEDRKIDFMKRLRRDDMPKGVAPNGSVLVMTIDAQHHFFWHEIRAFSPTHGLAAHCIDAGRLVSFDDIDRVFNESVYVDVSGNVLKVRLAMIDSGGTKKKEEEHSRTRQVYEFCRRRSWCIPYKGVERQVAPWRPSNVDFFPGTKEQIPGGVQLFVCDTSYYKDDLSDRLQNDPESDSGFTFYDDYPEEYLLHYTSEYRNDAGKWAHNKKIRNDLWDCGQMSLALADILRIADMGTVKKKSPPKKQKERKPKKTTGGGMW